jgi:hypothetical protein
MSDFQLLVDHTRFDLVRTRVNRACSPITDVLFVRSDELMCELAEVLIRPVNHAGRQRCQRWFEEGRIVVGTTGDVADRAAGMHRIDLHGIDGEARCEVLYLPPYYLVHLQGDLAAGHGDV